MYTHMKNSGIRKEYLELDKNLFPVNWCFVCRTRKEGERLICLHLYA